MNTIQTTEIRAAVKNIRISSEKVNLVAAQIKKLPPIKAAQVLKLVNKSAAPVLIKLIKSALANAKHNSGIEEGDLVFKEIIVTKGPMYKRFQPISRGRVHHILKRTSHIQVVLAPKPMPKEQKAAEPKVKEIMAEEKDTKVAKTKGALNGAKS